MTKKKSMKKLLSCVLTMVLIAAMALMGTACNKAATTVEEKPEEVIQEIISEEPVTVDSEEPSVTFTEETEVGEGETEFALEVVYADGKTDYFRVKTDADNVGAALLAAGLVEGEDSDYGLYIKKVNGVTADYDVDGTYWSFYINGEYAQTGVDSTPIEEGATYALKVEGGN